MIDRIELKTDIEKMAIRQGKVIKLERYGNPRLYIRIDDELIETDGKVFSFWNKYNDSLRNALLPFVDSDCEDEVHSDDGEDQLLSCEEYGRPRAEWCAVCNAKAVLGNTVTNTNF